MMPRIQRSTACLAASYGREPCDRVLLVRATDSLPALRRRFEQGHKDCLDVSPFLNGSETQFLGQLAAHFEGEKEPDIPRDRRWLCSTGYGKPRRDLGSKGTGESTRRRGCKREFRLRIAESGSGSSAPF